MFRYFTFFIILTLLGYLYEKYQLKYVPDEELKKYDLVREFLLNGGSVLGEKPILWIHSSYPINARWWPSFNSRNTRLLNQPYIISCIETAIKHCSNSFNIVLIDDRSFHKLLPNWEVQLDKTADPVRCHLRQLALSKLLYKYGGMMVPNSTIICKDLIHTYQSGIKDHGFFSVNMVNKTDSADLSELFPSTRFLGCEKESSIMKEFIHYLETLNSIDYTSESDFLGQSNRWLYKKHEYGKIHLLNGEIFGAIDKNNQIVNIDRLMGNTYIPFSHSMVGLYLPSDQILKRTKYEWFARLSQQQLRNCDTIAAKQLLIA
jgi:hypothetical protein